MKFSFASIAALDFFTQSIYTKNIIPGAHRQPPEGAGMRQPAQEPGIYLYLQWEVHKMDANTVIQAISNVGFPIAAFLLMWYQCNTVVKENTAAITEMRLALDDIKKES